MNNNKPTFTISNSTGKCSEEHSRRSYIPFSADKSLTSNNVIIYDCGDDPLPRGRILKYIIADRNVMIGRKIMKTITWLLSRMEEPVLVREIKKKNLSTMM